MTKLRTKRLRNFLTIRTDKQLKDSFTRNLVHEAQLYISGWLCIDRWTLLTVYASNVFANDARSLALGIVTAVQNGKDEWRNKMLM